MDLADLVRAAERGERFPPLHVLSGGALLIGTLGTVGECRQAIERGVSRYLYEVENPRRRPQAEETYQRVTAEAQALLDNVGQEGPESLQLLGCQVWTASGDGVAVEIATVPFGSVDAWWLGAAKRLPRKGGTGIVAGVLFPVGSE